MIIGMGGYPLSLAMSDFNMNSTPEIVVENWKLEGEIVIFFDIVIINIIIYRFNLIL